LHCGGIDADVASVVHLDSLREQLAQGFQFVGWIYKNGHNLLVANKFYKKLNCCYVRKNCIISNMSTFQLIQTQARKLVAGQLLAATDCLSLGSRAAIDQALYRMVKSGQLVRVSRGLYALEHPAHAQALAAALADKKGGLSVKKTTSPRKMALAKTAHGRVLLDLWARGEKTLTRTEIQIATADWIPQDIDAYLSLLPAWLRVALLQCHAKAKSVQLGLAGAYSWSNPQPRDELLIAKVLDQHRFEDMVRVCAHFGVPKVRRVFRQRVYEPMPRASVSRMLGNIAKGLKLAQKEAYAQA